MSSSTKAPHTALALTTLLALSLALTAGCSSKASKATSGA